MWPTSSSATPRGRAEDPSVYAGLHTHELADGTSDGIVHMEPLVREDAGNNATFGRFLQYGGWSLSDNEVALWDGTDRRAIKFAIKSRDCDGSPSKLRWALKSGRDPSAALVEQTGDINKYKMYDNDVIAIYVVAADADLKSFGDIPSEVNLHGDALSPSDFATS